MSLNPVLGHLYHDSSFADIGIRLDATEQLRIRQRNAREDRQLGKYSRTLDRAKTICQRRYQWEEQEVRNQLYTIKSKTPSLERGLQRESERHSRYEESMSNKRRHLISRVSTGTRTSCSTSSNVTGGHATVSSKVSLHSSSHGGHFRSSESVRLPASISAHSYAISEDDGYHSDANASKGNVSYIKKAENITKSLHKLYRRKKERQAANKYLMEYVRSDNKELLMKARVFFKDTEAANVLEKILSENDGQEGKGDLPLVIPPTFGVEGTEQINIKSYPKRIYINEIKLTQNDDQSNILPEIQSNQNLETNHCMSMALGNFDENEDKRLEHFTHGEKDYDTNIVSSVLVNPSVSSEANFEATNRHVKWSDSFGVPELWRLYYEKQKLANAKEERKTSLVTLTARYRRSLVR